MELRKHITQESAPINASESWVNNYNALQDRINSFIKAGMRVPEELLNGSHNMVNTLIILSNTEDA